MGLPVTPSLDVSSSTPTFRDMRVVILVKEFATTTLGRISVAALGALAVYKGANPWVLGALGYMLMRSPTLIAFGGYHVYTGASAMISFLATGSLLSLARGIVVFSFGARMLSVEWTKTSM